MPLNNHASRSGRKRGQRGHSMVEFALVSVFLVPLFVGTVSVGFNLTRAVSATQVIRDAGLMYARFVDFTLDSNKDILERLAVGMSLDKDGGGKGVLIFSKVMFADDDACTAANLLSSDCVNRNQYVITQRIVVGEPSLLTSKIGTPDGGLIGAKGNVTDYLKEASARADNFGSNVVTLPPRQVAYVTEGFFKGVGTFKFGGWPTAEDIYVRSIY